MLEDQKADAQQALDELFKAHLLPFKLSAYEIETNGSEEYIVRFHDSRLHSVDVLLPDGLNFKDVFRAAVLQRVNMIERPPLAQSTAAWARR